MDPLSRKKMPFPAENLAFYVYTVYIWELIHFIYHFKVARESIKRVTLNNFYCTFRGAEFILIKEKFMIRESFSLNIK
jgi:hypothetical protein